jgi:hypothetical protein
MPSKFKFSLDSADATARQFADIKRQLQELPPSIVNSVKPMVDQITQMFEEVQTLTNNLDQRVQESITRNSYTRSEIDAKTQEWNWGVLTPNRGGTGTGNAYNNLFTLGQWRAAWILSDGTMGTAQSIRAVKTDIVDADDYIPVDALRKVKWCIYRMKDDKNLNLDDAQPRVGMIADDMDENGLGFFCEYNDDGTLMGINYPMLGVAALRLAQQVADDLDALKAKVEALSTNEDKIVVDDSEE